MCWLWYSSWLRRRFSSKRESTHSVYLMASREDTKEPPGADAFPGLQTDNCACCAPHLRSLSRGAKRMKSSQQPCRKDSPLPRRHSCRRFSSARQICRTQDFHSALVARRKAPEGVWGGQTEGFAQQERDRFSH